jgi:hypothetical protein
MVHVMEASCFSMKKAIITLETWALAFSTLLREKSELPSAMTVIFPNIYAPWL